MSIKTSYNNWAATYDSAANKTRDYEKIVAQTTLARYTFEHVLELGCGTGKNTEWLLPKVQSLLGLDFSENMLAKAQAKIQSPKATFQQADLTQAWEVPVGAFDMITCSLVLEHIEDLEHIFDQASKTLQVEGYFYLCEYHPFKQYEGKAAKFETSEGTHQLEAFTHHVTDFTDAAFQAGFRLVEMKEWFDEDQKEGVPRLISFVFQKR